MFTSASKDAARRPTRGILPILASSIVIAFIAGAAVFGAPSRAAAADDFIHPGDISADDASALGWHETAGNATPAFYVGTFGLNFGIAADSRIMYGLVEAGRPGVPVTAADLASDVIDNTFVGINAGAMAWQIEVSTSAGSTTIEQVEPMRTTSPGTVDPSDLWQAVSTIGAIPAQTPIAISDLIAQLGAQGELGLRAYGLRSGAATFADRAIVQTIAFGDDQWNLGYPSRIVPVAEQETVGQADIRPDGRTPIGWYQSVGNDSSFQVQTDGLHLGLGADSEVVYGYETPRTNANLQSLVISGWFSVESGQATLVLGVVLGDGTALALRSADPVSGSQIEIDTLFQEWTSDVDIPASAAIPAIPAGQRVTFGDAMDALSAHGTVGVTAVGVAAQNGSSVVVTAIQWDGVVSSFAAVAPPVPPTPHVLPATGGPLDVALLATGVGFVAAGILPLSLSRRRRTA